MCRYQIAHAEVAKGGKGSLKFAPRLRDPACAGKFEIRKAESRKRKAPRGCGIPHVREKAEKRFELSANNGSRLRRGGPT